MDTTMSNEKIKIDWKSEVGVSKEPVTNKHEGVLEEAIRITSGDRQRDYGHPKENFQCIAILWNAYQEVKKVLGKSQPDEPVDCVNKMLLMKMARNLRTPKRDNWTDGAGYNRCGARVEGFDP